MVGNYEYRLLGSYFYVIGISYDKMHFTCIWINLSGFKIIITNGYIEDMKNTKKIAQEKLNMHVPIPILILVELLRFKKSRYLSQYLSIYRATRFLI